MFSYSQASDGSFSVLGDLDNCDRSDKSTCLSAITVLKNNMVKHASTRLICK